MRTLPEELDRRQTRNETIYNRRGNYFGRLIEFYSIIMKTLAEGIIVGSFDLNRGIRIVNDGYDRAIAFARGEDSHKEDRGSSDS